MDEHPVELFGSPRVLVIIFYLVDQKKMAKTRKLHQKINPNFAKRKSCAHAHAAVMLSDI